MSDTVYQPIAETSEREETETLRIYVESESEVCLIRIKTFDRATSDINVTLTSSTGNAWKLKREVMTFDDDDDDGNK